MKKYKFANEPKILKRVRVRLLEDHEREEFDRLLETKHYLCSAKIVGKTMRYVAELDGEWVALACFSASSLHLKAREIWIGWSPRQRARRLDFVVTNSRYLVLTDRFQLPNLSSRALAMCLRRLSRDWVAKWGHPVLVVESFVDESRYTGVSYRACGFEAVGATAGYSRSSSDYYHKNKKPKQLYLRELGSGSVKKLRQSRLPKHLAEHEKQVAGPCPFRAKSIRSLLVYFRQLKDSRKGHGLCHKQSFVLTCASIAVLMGAGSYKAMEDVCTKFTKRQLRAMGCRPDKNGNYRTPSDSTFFRVLKKLNVKQFDQIIGTWLLEQEISCVARLAVDGKVLRGSKRTDGKALQLLSAVTHNLCLTLAQEPINSKSNEIPAYPKLLRRLPKVDHALVTADALHCQQESARVTVEEFGWDYIFGLKGNQSGILKKAESLLSQQAFPP